MLYKQKTQKVITFCYFKQQQNRHNCSTPADKVSQTLQFKSMSR